jgi:hypothetical protein
MSSPPPSLTLFNWRDIFDGRSFRAGRDYARHGAVSDVEWDPKLRLVTAKVQGSSAAPYDVEIELTTPGGNSWSIVGFECSCPVRLNCKHIAAVLFQIDARRSGVEEPVPTVKPPPKKSGSGSKSKSPPASALPVQVESWIHKLLAAAAPPDSVAIAPLPGARETLVYRIVCDRSPTRPTFAFECAKSTRRIDGSLGRPVTHRLENCLTEAPARCVRPDDQRVARCARLEGLAARYSDNCYPLHGPGGARILTELLATGRCYWKDFEGNPLQLAPGRPGQLAWQRDDLGQLLPNGLVDPPATDLIPVSPPWFIDATAGVCGPVTWSIPEIVASTWLEAPPVAPGLESEVEKALQLITTPVAFPAPPRTESRYIHDLVPIPTLRLCSERINWWETRLRFSEVRTDGLLVLVAHFRVRYGDLEIDIDDPKLGDPLHHYNGSELVLIKRHRSAEERARESLYRRELQPASQLISGSPRPRFAGGWMLGDLSDAAIARFLGEGVPLLREEGWVISRHPDFALEICEPSGWFVASSPDTDDNSGSPRTGEGSSDWFDIELGVELGDEKINLLPVLLEGLNSDPGTSNAPRFDLEALKKLRVRDTVLVNLPDGRRIPFPAGRLRDILATLVELHGPQSLDPSGRLRVHRLRAAQIGQLAEAPSWTWVRPEKLQKLADRLRNPVTRTQPTPPPGLKATLRPYQLDGLQWLQFIREFGMGGVLADDMGLGKTVQTIAHLVLEKEQGRLKLPCLVVSPTSVLTNWCDELARFAPDLKVLPLHGSDRHGRFDKIPEADVLLTTYPLLPRDAEVLAKSEYHAIILDEAQNIKNPRTQAAQVLCTLKAGHRLCLTGTPLENHLGELWSLFNFLIPGFLADETRFRSLFRNPIEKANDSGRRKQLAQRVRPFLLRRRKDEVATELPPKTEIIRRVDLTGAQRDLYETIRLAMERRVREEVEKKGLDRSHIVILDALLKLRQVCCDPRLVPLEAARRVPDSAKLDLLMDLVPTLLEEGRRILLFSQFTSMLALIEKRLEAAGIPWLLLTGDTTDRATPVRRFQAGEVPLFLISLKAGGTGLNLTAADTVILYDPWWNPAVESQATDRAHRIGQDKPVFVYRLLTTGTVEEKINALQERKRELVEALLDEGASRSLRLGKEDLDALLAPIT